MTPSATRPGLLVLALAAACMASGACVARAQAVDPNLWVANGPITTVVRDGQTIYIGGSFSRVGPSSGGGVPLDITTGAPLASFPKVAGVVRTIVPDGSGGWYLGGSFTQVGGLPRNNVARVTSSMSVSSWNPNATGQYGYVDAIVPSGSLVYVGGSFATIGGQSRNNLAAVDTTTGLATSWNPNPSSVLAMVASGSTIYVGGKFASIGGQSRNRLAAFDATTGVVNSWNPNSDSDVYALAVIGSKVYAGGYFTNIGGQPRNRIAELEATSGNALAWDPNASQPVLALAVSGSIVYAGGDFVTIGGQSRRGIAALDTTTGAATAWNANSNSLVYAIKVSGSVVYAGGEFTTIGGQARNCLAALDAGTALATAWNPDLAVSTVDPALFALGLAGTTVYAGGNIVTVGGQVRNNIAALTAATGAVTAWNPNANAQVNALAVSGGKVYASGWFGIIGGQSRAYVAALDPATGLATSWNPNANDKVDALASSGSTVYVGGRFTNVGGQPRNYVAALDTATGLATSWNPNADNFTGSLVVSGSLVYAAGSFTNIGGQSRHYVAALDATSGLATSWDAQAGSGVSALALQGSSLYVGGDFVTIGGQPRNHIAALSVATAAATGWNPNADNPVRTLVANGTTLYAGGLFTTIGGQSRNFVATLDVNTGTATSWNPVISPSDVFTRVWPAGPTRSFSVGALSVGTTVYLGGDFIGAGGFAQTFVAASEPALAITVVSPSSGGNSGAVTLAVTGARFQPGTTIRLTRSGQSDLVGTQVMVAADGTSLTATLNLAGAAIGAWDVMVTGPDLQSATLVNGFTISAFAAPQLRVDIVGPSSFRVGYPASYDLVIQNVGNIDALSVPLWVAGIPTNATVGLGFTLSAPQSSGVEPDWSTVTDTLTTAQGRYLAMVIPRVPPGTVTRRVWLTLQSTTSFSMIVALTPPWVDGTVFRSCLSTGGVTSNATCMGSQLTSINAYLATHPEIEALNGVGLWAKEAWQCEGAATPGAAISKARQTLNLMVEPVEQVGTIPSICNTVLPPSWRQVLPITVGGSVDPNNKWGEIGTSITTQTWLPYTIQFENAIGAQYPAQHVIVSDPLDSDLDPSTVSLGRITFGSYNLDPTSGSSSYAATVPLGTNLSVQVSAFLAGSQLVWKFDTFHPDGTALAQNEGFLPPDDALHHGLGTVQFIVRPRATTANGSQISNQGTVNFDGQSELSPPTGPWLNTVDTTPPASQVTALGATQGAASFAVQWSAPGNPPDLKDYTVCVREDNGPYRAWRTNTTAVGDTFMATRTDHVNHTYAFYSVARDLVGNMEAPPNNPDFDTRTLSTTGVAPGPTWTLALAGARPNPARGTVHVSFTLADRDKATLEMIDVAGRRVERRDVGWLGPGPHVVTLGGSPRLKSGIYFLRLIQGERVLRSRVALVR